MLTSKLFTAVDSGVFFVVFNVAVSIGSLYRGNYTI